ncbi:ras-related protein Rab-5A-like [Drosophila serrata]|uniref:ras-related protein Rab-5A-like n=1 Tax=Drosophila serrata TaxID=7274 RepID=UPI000A1CF7C5|nr:ras-related protein Rab-5A-like [Drosophila serrata]
MEFPIVVLGDASVGKTSLISQYKWNNLPTHEDSTREMTFWLINKPILCPKDKLKVWDTPGRRRFQNVVRSNLPESKGALVVYDIHDRESYRKARDWVAELKALKRSDKFIIVLVGNKVDIAKGREVSTAEAKDYAKRHDLICKETSAVTKCNVAACFDELIKASLAEN